MPREFAEAVLDTVAALVVVIDAEARVVRFNLACQRLTGYAEQEVLGRVLWPLVLGPDEAASVAALFAQRGPEAFAGRHEQPWLTRAGVPRQILWSSAELPGDDGQASWVILTGLDVTEERQARLESDARFRALFDSSADGVVLIDPHDPEVVWRIVDCNEAFCRMNGYARTQLIGQSIDLLHPAPLMIDRGMEFLDWIRTEGSTIGEGLHRRADGSTFPIESSSSIVALGGRELLLGLDRDISARKAVEAQLHSLTARLDHEAHHDALTGLPNRTLLRDRLNIELARLARSDLTLAVLFIDLDDFKRVNDTLGHVAGDRLLQEMARRLQATMRPSDTVARIGGDEFVVVVPELAYGYDVVRVVQRIQAALACPFELCGQNIGMNSSIGISVAPSGAAPFETIPAGETMADILLGQADMAMYQAKHEGKNDLRFFSTVLTAQALDRARIEARLRRAIDAKALTLHYQPQFGVASGRLVGLEALLRWTDEELGVVTPDRFIPVAEDTGLIIPLGHWVLGEACRQIAEWNLQVPVAINVSPAQLVRTDFTDMVRVTLKRYGLAGTALKLEITERLVVRDPALAARRLEALRALGVRMSVDDFGAGQAGLSSLLSLPVDEVKLDRALIAGLSEQATSWRVIGALLSLARGLGLSVVAEGVETEKQLSALRELGCDSVQGYLTGRPAAPADLLELVRARTAVTEGQI